jgi:hypothetical protein
MARVVGPVLGVEERRDPGSASQGGGVAPRQPSSRGSTGRTGHCSPRWPRSCPRRCGRTGSSPRQHCCARTGTRPPRSGPGQSPGMPLPVTFANRGLARYPPSRPTLTRAEIMPAPGCLPRRWGGVDDLLPMAGPDVLAADRAHDRRGEPVPRTCPERRHQVVEPPAGPAAPWSSARSAVPFARHGMILIARRVVSGDTAYRVMHLGLDLGRARGLEG